MTYKEIVDKIAQVVSDHLIVQDFGYGALTDIKTVNDDGTQRVNYPYVFLNPTQSARTGQTIIYRFNLIAMDVCEEEQGYSNWLEVQSSCQQYIDDILAHLRFQEPLNPFDLTLNVNLTPFKERFQDTLAGMTATLEIEVPNKLNDCITPIPKPIIPDPPPEPVLFEHWSQDAGQIGTPGFSVYNIYTLESNTGSPNWGGSNYFTYNQVPIEKVTLDFEMQWDSNGGTTPVNTILLGLLGQEIVDADVLTGLPSTVTFDGVWHQIHAEWNQPADMIKGGSNFRNGFAGSGNSKFNYRNLNMKTYIAGS